MKLIKKLVILPSTCDLMLPVAPEEKRAASLV
jgi:hypothetical protein